MQCTCKLVLDSYWTNLSKKEREGRDFPRTCRAAPRDFLRVKPDGNSKEQACQPRENPILPDFFSQIYILFLIALPIGPTKRNRQFCIGLSKIHRRFRICPSQATLILLPPEFHSWWILVYHGYYARKETKQPIWNRMADLGLGTSGLKVIAKKPIKLFFRLQYNVRVCIIYSHIYHN